MTKKKLRRNKPPVNLFSWGGDSKEALGQSFGSAGSAMGSIGGIGSAIGTIASAAKDNAGIKDMSEEKAEIHDKNSTIIKATNKDELMDEWAANNPLKQNYKLKDVRGGSTGKRLLNTFNATTAGATTGAKVGGPWGAIIGGAAGLGSALAGWFSGRKKAKKLAKKMNKDAAGANAFVLNSLDNKAQNLAKQDSLNALANFSAFGGPIGFGSGAINFDLASQALHTKEQDAMAKQRFVSVPPSMEPKEETIINPFAYGGDMAGDFSNGVTQINAGGTHEENPNMGVQIGVDRNGTPNLVEEGEVVYDDFVFSNRIPVPDDLKKKYKLKGNTFANAAKALQKESQERPNDPISQRGLRKSMERLAAAQEMLKAEQASKQQQSQQVQQKQSTLSPQQGSYNPYSSLEYAYGGNLFAGGAFMDNPPYNSFLPVNEEQMAQQYALQNPLAITGQNPDVTEVPVIKDNNYALSPIQYPKGAALGDFRDTYNPGGQEINIVPDDNPWYNRPVVPGYYNDNPNLASLGNPVDSGTQNQYGPANERPTWMRYAPVAGAGLAVLSDIFSKPDYSNADAIESAANGIQGVSFNPIGNYLSYNPMDRDFYINKMNQQAAASRRAMLNSANGNQSMANALMLASDYNLTNSMGNFARQAEEYNQQQRERVETFNRDTNKFNSEGSMRAQMANMQRDAMRFRGKAMAAQMREQIAQQRKASRSANLNSLFQGLGDIGNENFSANMIDRNAGTVWKMDTKGNRYTSTGRRITNPSSRKTKSKSR